MKMKIILVAIAIITLCEEGMAESKLCCSNIVHRNFLIEYRIVQLQEVLIFRMHGNFQDECLKMGFFLAYTFKGIRISLQVLPDI